MVTQIRTFFGISFEYLRFVYWNYIFLEWSLFSIPSKFELKVKLWTIKFYIVSIFRWKSNNAEWQYQKYERHNLFIAIGWKWIVIQIMKFWYVLSRLVALISELTWGIKATKWGRTHQIFIASLVAQMVKNLPATWETWVQFLGWEDPLEKGMATHCSTFD